LTDSQANPCWVADDPYYGQLKSRLIALTGLSFYQDRDEHLAELIGRRLSKLGLRDCFSYSELLADGEAGCAELDAIIGQLTIGETHFFRDPEQFNAIRDIVLPEILERKKSSRKLRIWSAGCANGAEAYSLAILLGRDLACRTAGWQISILGTDINQQFLAEGQKGRFRDWALRSTSEEVKSQCFSSEGGVWTINPEYKQLVSFATLNLVGSEFKSAQFDIADFDLILCRNVMIYFSAEMTRRLILQFQEALAPKGWFLVSAVEHNLDNFGSFRTVDATGTTLYQKVAVRAMHVSWQPEALPPTIVARPASVASAAPSAEFEHPNVDGLRRLADQGDCERAIRYCQRLLALDGLNPVVHFYRAMVLEQMGIWDEAERSLRQAIYLDRNFALAHYYLGLALQRQKNQRQAVRSFKNVLKLLSTQGVESTVVAGDGVTVAGLSELARMHLDNRGGP
jgi:chemotaxis protein methyltransferase CheR